jgi:hypothetical protein|tara:strand:+ start:1204 stop:1449 length:246 start_codon:yes stop_codon:yes gene_type:complete
MKNVKIKGTINYNNEKIHYEVDKNNGYWRQWFDCEDKKPFSLKDIFIFSEKQMRNKLKCCDFHLKLSDETQPIIENIVSSI